LPEGYEVPYEDWGSVGEQILGRGDQTRSTKTFIEDGNLAMFLGLFESLPEMLMNTGKRLYAEEEGIPFEEVTNEIIFEKFPEARELIRIHSTIISHKGSQKGYLIDRYTGWATDDEMKEKKKEQKASLETTGGGNNWK
jgi:hypothetical protein